MYENALELHQLVMQAWQEHLGVPLLIASVLYVKVQGLQFNQRTKWYGFA